MPTLQEQDEDFTDSHAVRGQAAVPGAGGDEHCSQDVYEAIRHHSPINQWPRRGNIKPVSSRTCHGREEGIIFSALVCIIIRSTEIWGS